MSWISKVHSAQNRIKCKKYSVYMYICAKKYLFGFSKAFKFANYSFSLCFGISSTAAVLNRGPVGRIWPLSCDYFTMCFGSVSTCKRGLSSPCQGCADSLSSEQHFFTFIFGAVCKLIFSQSRSIKDVCVGSR